MVDNFSSSAGSPRQQVDESLVTYTNIIYALHSLSVLIGLTSAVTVVGSFIFGLPSIIAVIMNYARQSDARGSYLETHFRWQIRTFWFALLWALIIWCISVPLMLVVIGFGVLAIGFVCLGIWVIYRIVRGWVALHDRRPV